MDQDLYYATRKLYDAARKGSFEAEGRGLSNREYVNELIKQCVNVSEGMFAAAAFGHKELVDLFVKKGANNWNDGLFLSKTTSLKIFFIDQGADDKNVFPLFYKDICKLYHLSNGVLVSKLLRRYIARFRGNKLRNEKVIIDDKHESTLDQVFVSPPDTIVKFRDTIYKIKGFVFYVVKKRFN